jgi:hypothetical protein
MKIHLIGKGLESLNLDDHDVYCDLENDSKKVINSAIPDFDVFVVNLEGIESQNHVRAINSKSNNIIQRVKMGGLVICFAGREIIHQGVSNYSWIHSGFGRKVDVTPSREIDVLDEGLKRIILRNKLKLLAKVCFQNFSFPQGFTNLARNNSNNSVACSISIDEGEIMILPHCDDKSLLVNSLIRAFFSETTTEDAPKYVEDIKLPNENEKEEMIKVQEQTIRKEQVKKLVLINDLEELRSWKKLLWSTGDDLHEKVKEAFALLGLDLESEINACDLVGEYENKKVFIEVKGKTKCINHKDDLRQVIERKMVDSDDPDNTIAVLVGNPYRELPVEERPPSEQDLIARTAIKKAEIAGIGIVTTIELFEIIRETLSEKGIDKTKVLKQLMEAQGVFSYTTPHDQQED